MMKDFLAVKDDKKRAFFSDVNLVREVVKMPEESSEKLDKASKALRLSKTDFMRVGLELALLCDDAEILRINAGLIRGRTAGAKKGSNRKGKASK